MSPKKSYSDPFDDDDDEFFDEEEVPFDDEDLVGRLPGDEPYGADEDAALFSDLDEGLPPDKAASRRAMLGVPDFSDDEDNTPPSPARLMQDTLIEEVNDLLEDEWEWDAAAEKAYEALALDPTYGRAANALLRCYLAHNALREMQNALRKLFDFYSEDEPPHQRHRILAYSYRVLSRADFWLDWYEELPPENADVAALIQSGEKALRRAYFGGQDNDYQQARSIFKSALDQTRDRLTLMWYLARVYADKGYFADSAALLSALLAAGSASRDVSRLHAEMLWWRDHQRWLPWAH